MDERFVWWRIGLASEGPTLEAAPDLAVPAAPAAVDTEAMGAGALAVAPDPAPGLVPIARDIIPAPDLEESLALNQEKGSLILVIAGPVLDPTNPSLVHAPANPDPIQPIGNPSPVQRAVLR